VINPTASGFGGTQFNACDPCLEKCLNAAVFDCLPNLIPNPVAGCIAGLAANCRPNQDWNLGTYIDCLGSGPAGCAFPPVGWFTCLCRLARDCALCENGMSPNFPCSAGDLGNLIAGGFGRGGRGFDGALPPIDLGPRGTPSVGPLFSPSAQQFVFWYERYLENLGPYYIAYDDPAFVAASNEEYELINAFAEVWLERARPESEDGTSFSESEIAAILAAPRPSTVGQDNVERFIARWNRTNEYYALGIENLADLPAGFDDDFIPRDLTEALWDRAADNEELAFDAGFESTIAALRYYADALAAEQGAEFDTPPSAFAGRDDRGGPTVPEGVCATVRIEIDQRLALTRQAFSAALEISNVGASAIEGLDVDVIVRDVDGSDASDRFVFAPPMLDNLTDVDGGGTIAPGGVGASVWTIIPTDDAAPVGTTPYFVSGSMTYSIAGEAITVPLFPVEIQVLPNPALELDYFLETRVFADDPFTPEVEPSVPFSLGVLVNNTGAGVARELTITSSQPRIVENERGLLIDFSIIGAQVGGQSVDPSLVVDFGDLDAGEARPARWLMTSSLQGEFVSYDATFEHDNPFADPRLTLIDRVDIFGLTRVVQDTSLQSDGVFDFLADAFPDPPADLPDRLFTSDGRVEPVGVIDDVVATPAAARSDAGPAATLELDLARGFTYIVLDDPFEAAFPIREVRRSDGSLLPHQNFWQTDRVERLQGQQPNPIRLLHVFDHAASAQGETYTLLFDPDGIAPVIDTWTSTAFVGSADERAVEVGPGQSEPRSGGVERLVATASEPLRSVVAGAPLVSVQGVGLDGQAFDPADLGIAVNATLGDTERSVIIEFNPPLPTDATYCVQLAGLSDRAGNPLSGELVRLRFTALAGDVTGDARVNNSDVGAIATLLGTEQVDPLNERHLRSDIDGDGDIDDYDLEVVLEARRRDARFLPNPCADQTEPGASTFTGLLTDRPTGTSPTLDSSDTSDIAGKRRDEPKLERDVETATEVVRLGAGDAAVEFRVIADRIAVRATADDFAALGIKGAQQWHAAGWWTLPTVDARAEAARLSSLGLYTSRLLIEPEHGAEVVVRPAMLIRTMDSDHELIGRTLPRPVSTAPLAHDLVLIEAAFTSSSAVLAATERVADNRGVLGVQPDLLLAMPRGVEVVDKAIPDLHDHAPIDATGVRIALVSDGVEAGRADLATRGDLAEQAERGVGTVLASLMASRGATAAEVRLPAGHASGATVVGVRGFVISAGDRALTTSAVLAQAIARAATQAPIVALAMPTRPAGPVVTEFARRLSDTVFIAQAGAEVDAALSIDHTGAGGLSPDAVLVAVRGPAIAAALEAAHAAAWTSRLPDLSPRDLRALVRLDRDRDITLTRGELEDLMAIMETAQPEADLTRDGVVDAADLRLAASLFERVSGVPITRAD